MGTFTEGEPEELTGESWISGTLGVATVSASGLVTPVAEGTTTITVTKGDIEATAEIRVTAAELVSITLTPDAPSTPLGQTIQMSAMGTFTEGVPEELTGVSWISGTPGVATVSASGLVTPVAEGTTTMTVTKEHIEATAAITVRAAELAKLVVHGTRSLKVGEYTNGWSVIGIYTDGTQKNMDGTPFEFTSSNPEIAEFKFGINNSALYGISPGTTEITIVAKAAGVSRTFEFRVIPV
jgi:proline racemase